MRIPTIRSRLALLVIVCVVPAFLMTMTLISYGYQRERDRLVRDSLATARALGQAIDRELTSVRVAAEVLSTSPYLQSGDMAAFYDQAQNAVVRRHIGDNVVLTDAAGQQLLNTLRPLGGQLPRHGNREQLRKVFEAGRTTLSDVYIGGVLGRPVVSIDVPVIRDGRVVYDLSIGMLPDRFLGMLRNERFPASWIAAVFDSSGTIVARTHEMERFAGKKGSPELVQRMGEISEGSLEAISVEGIPLLSVFSRSSTTDWAVAIGIPRRELANQLRRWLWWVVSGAAILLVSSLGVAWAIGGRISRSIRGLTQPALALGAGAEVTVPSFNLKEADEVGQAVMKASRMLRQAQHLAHHDALTGLANRALFREIIDEQLAICQRTGADLAVLYIDLDGFKAVNDTHGHVIGDRILCEVAARLKRRIRGSDVAARMGGDEFSIVLVDTGIEAAALLAGELNDSLQIPHRIGPLTIEVPASIGVAGYRHSEASSEALLHRADEAMYRAKSAGGRRVVLAGALDRAA